MSAVRFLTLLGLFGLGSGLSGRFWHITDLHWDPTYEPSNDPDQVCASSGRRPASNAGAFGDYVCDSPWQLISSCLSAMRDISPEPDFILWTGDDTPHVPNEQLGEEAVLGIIRNLTSLIKRLFPDTKVYTALGNHDFHPKSQLPPAPHNIYNTTTDMWRDWLQPQSRDTFRHGGFYTEQLLDRSGYRMIVLNTNLYYDQNRATAGMDDPAGQFAWADRVLTEAAHNKEKVYITGHVPPGFFEKKRSQPWFSAKFNEKYLKLIQKHHAVILGQFFGHHHTDSFRMIYDADGSPVSTIFLTPGVTPWKTTLPGVEDGANNPGVRLFEYDTQTLLVKDMVTYYMNLTFANGALERWEKEYRLTESFRVADASPRSMHKVLERMAQDDCYLQKYYEYNSVSYDLTECDAECRADHVCAAREVDFLRYQHCLLKEGAAVTCAGLLPFLSAILSLVFTKYV